MFTRLKHKTGSLIPPGMIISSAQFALVAFLILGYFDIPHTHFLQGLLCGYALVGNIYWLNRFSKGKNS